MDDMACTPSETALLTRDDRVQPLAQRLVELVRLFELDKVVRVDILDGEDALGKELVHPLAHEGWQRLVPQCPDEQGLGLNLCFGRFGQGLFVPSVQGHHSVSVEWRVSAMTLVLFKDVVELVLVRVQSGYNLATQSFEVEAFLWVKDRLAILGLASSSKEGKVS